MSTFFSLGELNAGHQAVARRTEHTARSRSHEGNRCCRFLEIRRTRSAAAACRTRPYEFAEWKKAKVHLDYHVEIERSVLLGAVSN